MLISLRFSAIMIDSHPGGIPLNNITKKAICIFSIMLCCIGFIAAEQMKTPVEKLSYPISRSLARDYQNFKNKTCTSWFTYEDGDWFMLEYEDSDYYDKELIVIDQDRVRFTMMHSFEFIEDEEDLLFVLSWLTEINEARHLLAYAHLSTLPDYPFFSIRLTYELKTDGLTLSYLKKVIDEFHHDALFMLELYDQIGI